MSRSDRWAIFAGLYAGLAFGVFWLPLRVVEMAGFEGPWTMFVMAALPFLFSLPLVWTHRADYRRDRRRALTGGLLAGVAFSLYGVAFLYTDVVRAVLLFYLMPIWGFLLAWVFTGDRITRSRWLAMAVGVLGMAVMFGGHAGLPLPRNLGDWCALGSGFIWAASSLLILTYRQVSPLTHGVSFFGGAALFSLGLALIGVRMGGVAAPDWSGLAELALWAPPVAVVLIMPAGFAAVYAPTRLNPGVCGLLFMTEVGIAAVSAALFADEPMGARETAGLLLVLSAGLMEPVFLWIQDRRRMTPPAPPAAEERIGAGPTSAPRR